MKCLFSFLVGLIVAVNGCGSNVATTATVAATQPIKASQLSPKFVAAMDDFISQAEMFVNLPETTPSLDTLRGQGAAVDRAYAHLPNGKFAAEKEMRTFALGLTANITNYLTLADLDDQLRHVNPTDDHKQSKEGLKTVNDEIAGKLVKLQTAFDSFQPAK